jgi:hypothetical protein
MALIIVALLAFDWKMWQHTTLISFSMNFSHKRRKRQDITMNTPHP